MEALWIQATLIFLCLFNLSKFVRLCSEYCGFYGVIKYGSYFSLLSSAFADLLHPNDHLHFTRFQVSGKIGNRFLSTVTISLKSTRRNLNMNILEITMCLHQTKHNQYSNVKINAATISRRSGLKVKQVTQFKIVKMNYSLNYSKPTTV